MCACVIGAPTDCGTSRYWTYSVPAGSASILPSPRLSVVALAAFAVLAAIVGLVPAVDGPAVPHPAITTTAVAIEVKARVPIISKSPPLRAPDSTPIRWA
jgi:hypothetical protein